MTDWVRLWHDMPTDPKWRTIARKSGQRVGDVIAVFNFVICNASGNATERGKLKNFDCDDVASALDLQEADVAAIMDAMRGKVIDDDDKLTGWEKRQPKREDSTAFQRKQEWKERQRNATERGGTQRNAPETETETDNTLAKASDAVASQRAEFWANAKSYIGGKNPGGMIGKWLKDFDEVDVRRAITSAQAEGAVDPIPYIQRVLRKAKREADEDSFTGPC